jgi:hypothetical protein
MTRVKIDDAPHAVKHFISTMAVKSEGIELELNGRIVCRLYPPAQLSEEEKKALIDQRWHLIRQAQHRNRGVPALKIQREVRKAVEKVRRRQRS